ncbi:MAG TPA: VOC family protein [Firmicutes bacterium]|nr:VOC family protein [Candidatus Fermentithermobacillaceae bacterium]
MDIEINLKFVEDSNYIFNKMIPELTVFGIEKTKTFYIDILGFKIEYERPEDKFVFVSYEGSQFMFEEMHEDGWNVGEMKYPLGQGVNFSIEVNDIGELYSNLVKEGLPFYRDIMVSTYEVNEEDVEQREFIIQDPNGYLLRFTD